MVDLPKMNLDRTVAQAKAFQAIAVDITPGPVDAMFSMLYAACATVFEERKDGVSIDDADTLLRQCFNAVMEHVRFVVEEVENGPTV